MKHYIVELPDQDISQVKILYIDKINQNYQ